MKRNIKFLVIISIIALISGMLIDSNYQAAMYIKEKVSNANGLEYYYTNSNFSADLAKMKGDYEKCYNKNFLNKSHFTLRSPEDIHNCKAVHCKDFSYSAKLLAKEYGYECKYESRLRHSYIECFIDNEWRIIT